MKSLSAFVFAAVATCALYGAEPQNNAAASAAEVPAIEPAAVANDWNVTVGVGYRNFKRPNLKSATLPGFENKLFAQGQLLDATPENIKLGVEEQIGGAIQTGVQGVTTLTFVSSEGGKISGHGSYGDMEKVAPVIGFSTDFWGEDALSLSFAANFQYYTMDTKLATAANANAKANSHMVAFTSPNNIIVNFDRGTPVVGMTIMNACITKFDLDLYVFDAGLTLGYNFDNGIRAFVSGGPTFSVADMESSTLTGSTMLGAGFVKGRDNSIEFNWGLYVSAGASMWFTENLGVSLEVRYDEGFGTVGTRYATQSLDTWGGQLKLMGRF